MLYKVNILIAQKVYFVYCYYKNDEFI